MAWIKKLLLPNRYDCLYTGLGILCFLAIFSVFVAHYETVPTFHAKVFIFLLAAVGICLFAISVVIAFNKHSWPRVLVLGLSAAALPPVVLLAFVWKNEQLIKQISPGAGVLPGGQQNQTPFEFASVFWLYLGTLLLPLASWLRFSLIRQGPNRIKETLASRFGVTRSRFLVGLAGVMLLIGVTNNILISTIPSFGESYSNVVFGIFGILFLIVAFIAIIYFPSRFLVGGSPGWLKLLFSIVILGLVAIGLWLTFFQFKSVNDEDILISLGLTIGICLYLLSLVGLQDPNRQLVAETAEPGTTIHPVMGLKRLPSIWCLAFLLVLAGLTWFPFRYDLATLADSQSLERARDVSTFRWKSKGQIRRHTGGSVGYIVCEFDETTEPGVLGFLHGDPANNFWFNKLSPQVDFSVLERKQSPISGKFGAGQITSNQLNEFLSQPAGFVRFGGCDVIDTGQKIDPEFINQLYFMQMSGTDLHTAKILAMFESFENVDAINLQHDLVTEDWIQVIRASKHSSVSIFGKLPENLSKQQIAQANGNIHLTSSFFQPDQLSLTPLQKNWLENSNIAIDFHWDPTVNNSDFIHQLLFAFPHRFQIRFSDSFSNDVSLLDSTTPNYFIFERDENGIPTGLCLPFGESNPGVRALTELKALSFDECWIQHRSTGVERNATDLSGLTKLEHLAFSANSSFDRIDFLARLKLLKHLQIPTVYRTTQRGPGFDSCPSLETITMLGTPDAKSVLEFQRLPKLKILTIVDIHKEFVDDEARGTIADANDPGLYVKSEFLESLNQQLPGVEITIVDEKGFSPLLPDSFKRHLDKTQKLLREKLLLPTTTEPIE